MKDEISGAIREKQVQDAAIEMIESRHHHDDGSTVVITPFGESDFERKVIEEEQAWKLKTQHSPAADNFSADENAADKNNRKNDSPQQQNQDEPVSKKKPVVASCSCGQLFSVTSNANDSARGLQLKTYEADGSPIKTYAASLQRQQDYSAPHSKGGGYGAQ